MTERPIERLRAICLALPEAVEKEAWGDPTFRVREKIFAMEKRGDGRVSVWCKAPPGSQEVLVGADSERFFVPPYVGHKGWVGMRLDCEPDWDEVALLVRRSYRLIAPKRLAAMIEWRRAPRTAGLRSRLAVPPP
jgi:predicted DNA-binding protein (MmcQ/YjbR family)